MKNFDILKEAVYRGGFYAYPGYPFECAIAIDGSRLKNGQPICYTDIGDKCFREISSGEVLDALSKHVAYLGIGCSIDERGSWIVDRKVETVDKHLELEADDFYIDDVAVVKFWFLFISILNQVAENKRSAFVYINEDEGDYVTAKVFKKNEDMSKWFKEDFGMTPTRARLVRLGKAEDDPQFD